MAVGRYTNQQSRKLTFNAALIQLSIVFSLTLGSLVNTVLQQVAEVLMETPCFIVKKCYV